MAEANILQEFQLPIGQGVPDIWQEIFNYLTNPTDFQNLLLASPEYFEPLLEDRKSAVLFPLVLQILDRWDYLAKSKTLECSWVSKFTKSFIETWILDGNPCLENLDGWDHDTWDPKHQSHCLKAIRSAPWQRMDNGDNEASPFVGGYINFRLLLHDGINEVAQLLQDFRLFLAKFGKEIRYFKVFAVARLVECLEFVREFLEQMSNLRTLDIFYYALEEAPGQGFNPETLPNLRYLSTIRIDSGSARLVDDLLAKYGTQLKKICLADVSQVRFNQLPFGEFRNLTQVSLPWIGYEGHVLEYLNPALEWLPTLETLSVSIRVVETGSIFLEVLVALENCFRTSRNLQNLNIYLDDISVTNISIDSPVRFFLPSLKRLWIRCEFCCLSSIDFILGIGETLEEFTLHTRLHRPSDELDPPAQEISQVKPLLDRMQDPNLWEEMSKLERITIMKRINMSSEAEVYSFSGRQKSQMNARVRNY